MLINLKDTDRNLKIFRILPFANLLEILSNSKITLVKPKLWDDPYENFLFKQTVQTMSGDTIPLKKIEERVYGNCWTFNSDSDFSWRVYAPAKDGIQIESTIGQLHDNLNEKMPNNPTKYIKVGQIQYRTWDEMRKIYEQKNGFSPLEFIGTFSLFMKRIEFSAENEVRVIAENFEDHDNDIWELDIEPNAVLNNILVDPRLSERKFHVVKKVVQMMGYQGNILHSTLYSSPQMNITVK